MRFFDFLNEKRGSEQTKLGENAQCITIALYQTLNRIPKKEDFTIENIKRSSKFFEIDIKNFNEILSFLFSNEDWFNSSIYTLESLKNFLKFNDYVCHRNSSFMKEIYITFKNLKKDAELLLNDKINDNKWNPGDIWLSKIKNIPSFNKLIDYNKWLDEMFFKGLLISVSLKKTTKKNPPFKIYNKFNDEITTYVEIKDFKMPRTPYETTNTTIKTSEDDMVIRTFNINNDDNVRIEIAGEEAVGGKASFSLINNLLKKYLNTSVISKNDIIKMNDEQKIELLKRLYDKIGFNYNNNLYIDGLEALKNKETSYNGWWISKIQSLDIASKLISNKKIGNYIVTTLFLYASSQGIKDVFQSSIFLKIGK